VLKKKIWANFQRIIKLFTQKIVNKLSKIWIWDPGSGIRDPGSGKTFGIIEPEIFPGFWENLDRDHCMYLMAKTGQAVRKKENY
jgi:hypothetical protein